MSGDQRPTILRISEHKPEEFLDDQKLISRIKAFVHERQNQPPIIFSIEKPEHGGMNIGVGARQGLFLHYSPENLDLPYLISETSAEPDNDTIDYYLFGTHHTEIETRHIIGVAPALEAIAEFCRTGALSDAVNWTEV